MLPEDVKGTTSSLDGQRQRRRVEFNESGGEDSSDSERGESDFVEEEEGEEQGAESELSARTKQKSRSGRRRSPRQKGTNRYIPALNTASFSAADSMTVNCRSSCECAGAVHMYSKTSILNINTR